MANNLKYILYNHELHVKFRQNEAKNVIAKMQDDREDRRTDKKLDLLILIAIV